MHPRELRNGEGIYAYPDGSKYQGLFYNQKPDGRGIFFYPNGDRYQGEFKNGYPHGEGTMYHAAGGKRAEDGLKENFSSMPILM